MYILFYKGTKAENSTTTVWDRLICSLTRSRWSHVEISWVKQDNNYLCWSSSIRDGGVRVKVITAGEKWYVIQLSTEGNQSILNDQLGAKYDYLGLLGAMFRVPWFSSKSKWFCSEVVGACMALPNTWKYRPEDLFQIATNSPDRIFK